MFLLVLGEEWSFMTQYTYSFIVDYRISLYLLFFKVLPSGSQLSDFGASLNTPISKKFNPYRAYIADVMISSRCKLEGIKKEKLKGNTNHNTVVGDRLKE